MSEATENDNAKSLVKSLNDIERELLRAFNDAVTAREWCMGKVDYGVRRAHNREFIQNYYASSLEAAQALAHLADSIVKIQQQIREKENMKPSVLRQKSLKH